MVREKTTYSLKKYAQSSMLSLCLLLSPLPLWAEEASVDVALYPQFLEMPSYIYDDYLMAYERVFSADAAPYWWAIAVSTAVLLAADDALIKDAQALGRDLAIARDDHTTTVLAYDGMNILRLPTDFGSLLYFIGDGWTHAGLATGFMVAGAWSDDDKAYEVGFQIIEGMVTTAVATQFLKHITGRESPSRATTPTGRWDFFPNQVDYQQSVPAYDAFPSGHVAVGTMTLTVIAKNYPEKAWIMPVGVTLLSLLSFQMLNNEAHWASDYPLAIALGYTFGSLAFERGQASLRAADELAKVEFIPLIGKNELGMGLHYAF